MKSIDAKRWNHLLGLRAGTYVRHEEHLVTLMFDCDGLLAMLIGVDEFWERQR